MGRGKIEIKFIENPTNRQVTYSKRRNGIFKKAHELSVLCDAKVSLIMFSRNNKMHEYISPGLTTKKVVDQYQKTLGNIDLWHAHYERMLENLKRLQEINSKLRKQIRNKIGEDLEDLSFQQLRSLDDDMVSSIETIRDRKYHVIKTRTDTCRKKVRSYEQVNGNLLRDIRAKSYSIHPQYEVLQNEGDPETEVALANEASNFYAFCQHHGHVNLHHHHDLRLA